MLVLIAYSLKSLINVPVTPSRVSTALARSCLNFQSAVRSSYFSWKGAYHGVLRASLQRQWRCYRARMSFCRVPTELSIICALTTLSLRFHSARNACTAISRCPHCADGVLKMQCRHFPTFPKFWPEAC